MNLLTFILRLIKPGDYISVVTIENEENVFLEQYNGLDTIESLNKYYDYKVINVFIQFNVVKNISNYFIKISKDM